MNPVSFFSDIVRDIRFAVRMLYKNRSFALSAIVTLGLGSSVGIVIYTVIYGFAFRPLPVKDPNNVKKIYETVKGVGREWEGSPFMFSHPEYLYYRDHNSSFSDLIAYAETNFRISGTEELNVPGELVSGNYFPALGLSTTLGRTFTPEEDQTPVANPVAIISTRLWRQRFSSSLDVIGRSVTMNGVLLNIIGVAAPNVVGAEITAPDVWVPIMMEPLVGSSGVQVEGSNLSKSNCSWLTLLGRLRPGTTMSQAQAEMALLASQYDSNIPDRRTTITVTHAAYLTGLPTAPEMRQLAAIVSVVALAVVLILLIVCTNVSNLFLARAMVRRKEFAIKVSQGATRGRLIQELLTESVVIGLIGGGVALGVAWWMMKLLSASIPDFPAHLIAAPDLNILLVTLLVAVVTGLSSGLPPALSATRLNINSILKEEGFSIGRRKRSSVLGSLLLVAQLAGCLVLLISTALLARGLQNAKSIDLGFQPKNVYLVSVDFQQQKYDDARASVFYRRLLEQLEAIPDVKSVSLASTAPLLGVNQTAIVLETDQDDAD
ncbi:MAG TPA: ABC transporter permease, partial [Blastocatellia bacterium]|nr:ABC transporter permease [Blastocatellia bacterium]